MSQPISETVPAVDPGEPRMRRVPQQERSRRRVEAILDAAARIVVAEGVDAVGTRSIADLAGVPVASLYQYFADKDDILLALVERDMAEMDEAVGREVGALETISLQSLVEATIRAFTLVYVVGTAAALRLLPRGTWVRRGAAVSLASTLVLLGLTGRHLLPQLVVVLAAVAWMAWRRRTLRGVAPAAPDLA